MRTTFTVLKIQCTFYPVTAVEFTQSDANIITYARHCTRPLQRTMLSQSRYNAKATFFNIGIQATTLNMTHATHFTKRLLREGHTLGGHTYVHDEL